MSRKIVTVKEIHIPRAEAGSDFRVNLHLKFEGSVPE
jgi:hypothetical protein